MKIIYKTGYKYQLAQPYVEQVFIYPTKNIKTPFVDLDTTGVLTVKAGYAWDGTSGPIIDTEKNIRGSLVHDALYGLMRTGELEEGYQDTVDALFKIICLNDGTSLFLGHLYYKVLQKFGYMSIRKAKKMFESPR